MKQILRFLKPYTGRMIAGLAIKTSATLMTLLIPWATTEMLKTVVPTENLGLVFLWGGLMLAMAGLDLAGNIIANRMASLVARNTTERIRLELFAKISYLSLSDQEKLTGESLISRATSDTYNVHHFLGMMQRFGVRQPIIFVVSLIITFFMDAQLTIIMLIIVPIMGASVYLFLRYGRPMYRKVQEALDRFVRIVREDVNGIRVIKALSKGDTERKRFHEINEDVVRKNQTANLVMGGMHPVVRLLLNGALILIIWFGAKRVNSGLAESETLLAFMTYITMILNAVINLTRFVLQFTQASVSGNRIAEILNTDSSLKQEEETSDPETIEKRKEQGEIVFDHVSFAYDKHLSTLEDISFAVKQGDTLGIIGATGSGKSALVNLLMRFYDVSDGAIYVEGRNVKTYDNQELKGKFGAVFQNDLIFRDTIRENIRFGRDIPDEEIMRAARAAQAEFVFDRGLDEKLTIRGSNLSGGQKQRIFIARALAGNPKILILDDASSALDYATDAALREAIRKEYPDTTLVVVAQRISSIMNADDILVLDEGKLIGQGKHGDLMKTCSVYREIAESQMGNDTDNGLTEEVKAEFVRMAHDHPLFRDTETYDDVLKRVVENQKAFAKRKMYRECISTVKEQLKKENSELGNGGKKRVFVRLMKYLFRHPFLILSALALTIVSNLLVLSVPKLSGMAMDAFGIGTGNVDFSAVTTYCIEMIIAVALSAVVAYLTTVVMSFLTRKILSGMRRELFDRLLNMRVSFFDTHAAGEVISRITYDVTTINTSLSSDVIALATNFIMVVGSFVMMLTISPILVLVFAVTVPISVLYTKKLSGIVRPLFRARSGKLGEMNGFIEEMISGQKSLKAYHRELDTVRRFQTQNERAVDAYYRADYMAAFNGPSVMFLSNLSMCLVTIVGAVMMLNHAITLGNISSFILYNRRFSGPINETANIIAELQSAFAAAEKVFRVLDEPVEEPLSEHEEVLSEVIGDVKMSHVNFSYVPGIEVIRDFSMEAEPGKIFAIVGPTGAGKTTIINLLMRFYDIQSGRILIDGKETRELTRESVRKAFAMVLQDTWLFTGTVYENLVYGRTDATKEEVIEACRAAHIHNTIMRLPNGYDTLLTDEGANISKGQKQLLTIARAMLLNAHMLILDEATSNVDTRTEIRLQKAMNELMAGKTCFIIAHRLSTIRNADRILVVNKGDVVEQGTHDELMAKGGFYHDLYEAQWSKGEII